MVTLRILFLLFLFVLAVFSSSSETALFAANRYHLKGLALKGSYRAKLILAVMKHPEQILATILFMNTLANVGLATVATAMVADWVIGPHRDFVPACVTVVLTIFLLIFSEFTPKTIAAQHADSMALALIQPLRVMMAVSRPVVVVGSGLAKVLLLRLGHGESRQLLLSNATLRSLLDDTEVNAASSDRDSMLHGVLSLSDLAVKSVIIPRPEVTAIPIDATADEIFEIVRTSGYSRLPVYRNNLDNIVGILHSKDVLPRLVDSLREANRGREPLNLTAVMRKPLFVPDTAKVDTTLKYMQKNRIHLAVVIEEHGGMEGIVTLEDLLEQIVGEIQDEHDFELDAIRHLPDNAILMEADISIREVNKRLKMGLPESSHYSTLAGFLLAQAGRLLRKNDEVLFPPWKFIVLDTEGRRLVKVRMERTPADPKNSSTLTASGDPASRRTAASNLRFR